MKRKRLVSAVVVTVVVTAVTVSWAIQLRILDRAQDWIADYDTDIRSGAVDRAISRYATEFFANSKSDESRFRATLARLGAPTQRILYNSYVGLRRGDRGFGFYIDLSYETTYGTNGGFNEDFELVRDPDNEFLITFHGYD